MRTVLRLVVYIIRKQKIPVADHQNFFIVPSHWLVTFSGFFLPLVSFSTIHSTFFVFWEAGTDAPTGPMLNDGFADLHVARAKVLQ